MIAELTNNPQNIGSPFACMIQQPDGSAIRPEVILRAKMQARIGAILFDAWIEIGRHTFEAPSLVGSVGRRVVAVGAISGALAYQAECNAADIEEIDLQTGAYLALVEPLTWLDSNPIPFVGNETSIEVGIVPASAGALSVGIEQSDASIFGASVKIEALFESGYVELGRYAFDAPAPGPGKRLVALAAVPGALSYRITAASLEGTGVRPYAQIGTYRNLSGPLSWLVNGGPPAPGASTQPISVTYVAPNGNDATGQRGNYDQPFLTIDAALAAMQQGDTLMLAPGEYAPCEVPSGLQCTLIGMGSPRDTSVRIVSTGGAALSWSPVGVDSLTLRNIRLQTTDAGAFALEALGDGVTNFAVFVAENCKFFSAATAAAICFSLDRAELKGCEGNVVLTDCNSGLVEDLAGGDLFLEVAEPIPAPVFHTGYVVKGSQIGFLTQADNARVEADQTTRATFVSTRAGAAPVGPVGRLYYHGEAEDMNLVIDEGVSTRIQLQEANVTGTAILTSTATVSDSVIDARGANFSSVLMGDSGAGVQFVIDLRGGSIRDYFASFFDTNCKVDRDGGSSRVTVPPGLSTFTFSSLGGSIQGPAYPAAVQVSYVAAPSVVPAPGESITLSLPTGDGFDVTSTYAIAQDVEVIYSRHD